MRKAKAKLMAVLCAAAITASGAAGAIGCSSPASPSDKETQIQTPVDPLPGKPDNGQDQETEQTPVDPVDPTPSEQITLEKAVAEFNAIATRAGKASSLTALVADGNDNQTTYEISGNKLQVGNTIYETESDKTFKYAQVGNEWIKTISADELSSAAVLDELKSKLGNLSWTGVKKENDEVVLQGKNILGTYNTAESTLTFVANGNTYTIYGINGTSVSLPANYNDQTQPKEFKVEEHIDELMTGLENVFYTVNRKFDINAQFIEAKNVYLTKSEESNIVDSVGVVFVSKRNGEYLLVRELKIPNRTTDITYEEICEHGLNFDYYDAISNEKFTFSVSRNQEAEILDCIDILAKHAFGEDYADCDWLGSKGLRYNGIADSYDLVRLKDGKIEHVHYGIREDNSDTKLEAIQKNFIGQPESNSQTTWKKTIEETPILPDDTLVLSRYLQNDIEETN